MIDTEVLTRVYRELFQMTLSEWTRDRQALLELRHRIRQISGLEPWHEEER